MKRIMDERGQTLVFAALCMSFLLGSVSLAVDVGTLFNAKRNLQVVADAAALAGATQITINTANVTSAAKAAATQNGVTDGTNGIVTVNYPNPAYGAYHNATTGTFVEVIVQQPQKTFFLSYLLGIMDHTSSMSVSARAVAWHGATTTDCIYVLAGSGSDTMDLQGNFTVTAPNCGIIIDSTDSNALQFTGGAGTLSAGFIGVTGGDGGQTGDATPTPVTGVTPVSDPLAQQFPPLVNTGTASAPVYNSAACGAVPSGTTIGPVSASGTVCYGTGGNVSITGVTLNPGTYVINGNLTMGAVTGTGVTLYLLGSLTTTANQNITLDGTGSVNFPGVVIYAPKTNSNILDLEFGAGNATLTGIIYAPGAELLLHDAGGNHSGGVSLTTDLIVNTLKDTAGTLNLVSYSKTHPGSPLSTVALVE